MGAEASKVLLISTVQSTVSRLRINANIMFIAPVLPVGQHVRQKRHIVLAERFQIDPLAVAVSDRLTSPDSSR